MEMPLNKFFVVIFSFPMTHCLSGYPRIASFGEVAPIKTYIRLFSGRESQDWENI